MVFLIVNRGIFTTDCFWWKISDFLLKDASGINLYYKLKKKYGKMIKVNMAGENIYVVTDINYIAEILNNSPLIFGSGKLKRKMFGTFMEKNVGVSEGCPWIQRRKITENTLDTNIRHRYSQHYHEFIKHLFQTNKVPLANKDFNYFSKRLAMKIVFNEDEINEDIFKVFSEANSLKSLIFKNREINKSKYLDYLKKHIKNPNNKSLISIAGQYTNNMDELIHHIPHWIFPIAGVIPTTFSRLLLLLCNHPKKFQILINNIKLGKYEYLRKCILETLRLNNPVVTTFRTLLKDYYFGKKLYKNGTQFLILNNPVLRNPDYFIEPNKYIPERWTKDMEKSYYSIMFNQGPQMCPGKELVLQLLESFTINYLEYSNVLKYGHNILKCKKINITNIPQMMNPCKMKFEINR